MRQEKGSALIAAVFIASLFLLLTWTTLFIHRQYIDDTELTKTSSELRQILLDHSSYFIREITEGMIKAEVAASCVEKPIEKFIYEREVEAWYSLVQLPSYCYPEYRAYQILIKNALNDYSMLGVDIMMRRSSIWENLMGSKVYSVLLEKDTWLLAVQKSGTADYFALLSSEDGKIINGMIRESHNGYEILFVAIGQGKLTLHKKMIRKNAESGVANWDISVVNAEFKSLGIVGHNVYMTVKRGENVGLVALKLDGRALVDGFAKTYFQPSDKLSHVVAECPGHAPLIIDDFWQVGCQRDKIVRYHFQE